MVKYLLKKILQSNIELEVSYSKIIEKYPFHYNYDTSIAATLNSDWANIGSDIRKAIDNYGTEIKESNSK